MSDETFLIFASVLAWCGMAYGVSTHTQQHIDERATDNAKKDQTTFVHVNSMNAKL